MESNTSSSQLINYPHPHLTENKYVPLDTWNKTKIAIGYASVFGLITVATRNSLYDEKVGSFSMIKRSGGLWGLIVLVAGAYKFSLCALSNIREKKDAINEFYAGSIAGAVAGISTKNLIKATGCSIGSGVLAALFYWSGSFAGLSSTSSYAFRGKGSENKFTPKASNVVEKQGFWEVSRRRPLSQTLEELGSGAFKQ